MVRFRTSFFVNFMCFVVIVKSQDYYGTTQGYNSYQPTISNSFITEHPGGTITDKIFIFSKSRSPYVVRNDLIIERNAEVVIEPGVQIRFEPQIGITVRGILTALGTDQERITLTSSQDAPMPIDSFPSIRLVDGPSILAGRVQLKYNGKWRSVCTNSKNWTHWDMETACRQLGFQGGSFYNWFNREMPLKPRLLYEEPKCIGQENSIFQCNWSSRQLGSGVCDYHPDLAIQCLPAHDSAIPFWRGIRYENAYYDKVLSADNTLYVPTSFSRLTNVNIKYAGRGRNQNTTSAIEVNGIPPIIDNVDVLYSAYNGMNITNPNGPIFISNCRVLGNRGHGIFVNSSYGMAKIHNCFINGNGGDGVKYVHNEERPDENRNQKDISDFCTLPTTDSQTFPIIMYASQSFFHSTKKICTKVFKTKYGQRLTLRFLRAETDRNNSAEIQIYDGASYNNRLITNFKIRNNTRPQSLISTSNQIYIKFIAAGQTNTFIYMQLTSGLSKSYNLNVSNSDISENEGRGIGFENLRTQLYVSNTTISKNNHVAGLHVTSGVGDVNVTNSRISFNEGDGINITYTGGARNISRTSISSNKGYGIAVWLNDTKETEYIFVNQSSVIEYSEIIKNLEIGVLHGNFCGDSNVNITANVFKESINDALEILSCWKYANVSTKLQIGHNKFIGNNKIGLKISPALNLNARIEYNMFERGVFGAVLIKNKPLEEFNILRTNILIQQNYFHENKGIFVVNVALSPYSEEQHLLFTRNFVRNNEITEPFLPEDGSVSKLNPRSRVAAPIVIASNNVDVFRNIIDNPKSKYEIGSHLLDQSKSINCSFNYLGNVEEEKIFNKIFHRNDRYNLAQIIYIPYLLHNTNFLTNRYETRSYYVPRFIFPYKNVVGGEVEGEEHLSPGEYIVEKDINIRPGGKLIIDAGVTLRFPPSIGIMVGGRLEASGRAPDSIKFTLKEEITYPADNETFETDTEHYADQTEVVEIEPLVPIRLLGGKSATEGRLQVKIDGKWGTVCNYGWNIVDAALICHQLGLTLNPEDWNLERNEVPMAGITEPIILSNVQCDEYDTDITKCKSEKFPDFENSCTHDSDVGIRCYDTSWAGIRFGGLSERSDIQFITIEKSGLLDYTTNAFKPALQLDFARHNFQNIKVTNNFHDGLGIIYSDIYKEDTVNVIRNSEFTYNKGAGISFKQLGLQLYGSIVENNYIGIQHNPSISGLQQREFSGWFISLEDNSLNYKPFKIPHDSDLNEIRLEQGETKYVITTKVIGDDSISRIYKITTEPGFVIGVQLLNPIENRSSEVILIQDSLTNHNNKSAIWNLNRDLTVFPTTSSSHGIIINYISGSNAIGGTVLILSTIRAPIQSIYNRIVKGPIPTLTIKDTKIKNNIYGLHASYYNRYLNELGDHFLRKSNETIKLIKCEISHNEEHAIFIHSPHWDLHKSNISEITFMINNSLITDNGKGIYQFSRDMRSSNNLFHYIFQDDTIERNNAGGFEINLPYVWQYNENFTHSVYMNNITWRLNNNFEIQIDGHFAIVNITKSVFSDNQCKTGLISIRGMEKKMLIDYNRVERNNGIFIVDFSSNSQSEIIGEVPAKFIFNELRNNKYYSLTRGGSGILQLNSQPTSVVRFKGIQKVNFNRNLFTDNSLEYLLIAGIKTAKIKNFLDVTENWWGTTDDFEIRKRIFDFDDWNDHAIADFRPYLTNEDFQASLSTSFHPEVDIDYENLGGKLLKNVVLIPRETPYVIKSDITVMPKVTFTIYPGVVMEFAPNVGILVLGTLKADGIKGNEIIMRPITTTAEINDVGRGKRELEQFTLQDSIRLCKSKDCTDDEITNEGFLEYFNKTTLQWIPMCDPRFTERNAQVVCRELSFDPINAFFDRDIRIEYHSNSLTRIWSWPEPLQCSGTETKYEDCPIRLNGQQFGHRYECKWNSKFIFIHCGKRNLKREWNYWGGVRFADSEFEQQLYNHRIHNPETHDVYTQEESILRFVNIIGAGILHNEKSPAIQSIIKSPKISYVSIKNAASHGINLISPASTMNLLSNNIENTLGVGINILSLTGEGQEGQESSFNPLKSLNIPYNLFSLIDICDTTKEIIIEERVLVYYKYDNHPVNCVKIFKSHHKAKPFGFRLLQFNLFNSTLKYGIPDFIQLYDGDIYNVSSKIIGRITMNSKDEKKMYKTKEPSLSVKLFANGASSDHGFIAEIVTLPISAIVFNRDVQHNITNSQMLYNKEGGILYASAGEVNPIITIDRNRLKNNCKKLYGNFTTCEAAANIDVQNTLLLYFRNNLVEGNQGGLSIKADSRGSATSLKGHIHNNLFVNNSNYPALYVEGRQSSPYQDVVIYRNYFTRNVAQYENNIVLRQVVSNFTHNYVKNNVGLQNLEVSGFDKVRLPIYQTTAHNGFYMNYAVHRDSRSTIVAGTGGQHYVDNIFFNPDNDYEMITVNKSLFDFNSTLDYWKTKIAATHNYWGFNTTLAVSGRIRDQSDDPRLLEVTYKPYYETNVTVLNGKCPPAWELVGDTCYIYIGAPMTFHEARTFCHADNASMPYLIGTHNYPSVNNFLSKQQQWYFYSEKVWVQHIDMINQCTVFVYDTVEKGECEERLPFLCEIDPKVYINPLAWHGDLLTILIIVFIVLGILFIACVGACWWSKSKYRHAQRLERRNSIRQSLHSLKSVGSTNGFSDYGYRRKVGQLSTRSTDTLTKSSDYKKMVSNGSIDSMEKSYNSSIDDNQSYDVYEANNPTPSGFSYNTTLQSMKPTTTTPFSSNHYAQPFNLAYRNEGFKDNSTFASGNSNYQSRAESQENTITSDETPIINSPEIVQNLSYPPSEYYTTDTLPLSTKSTSTLTDVPSNYKNLNGNFLQELKQKLPTNENLPTPPPIPKKGAKISHDYNQYYQRQMSEGYEPKEPVLETNFDEPQPKPKIRSKSEALLETNFDFEEPVPVGLPISEASRSKSQPLETAM